MRGVVRVGIDRLDEHDPEVGADERGASEERGNAVWGGVGGDVVVRRGEAQEFIAHAAAGEVGDVSGVAERSDDANSDIPGGEVVGGRTGHGAVYG